ncbi:hypothetical protein KAFR_0A01650 [Kazachstania africana CBS 2517]|uniref:Inactive deaminase YJL070C n=1 Tax=Kazachstania africana (strain ATCC 22294 / BCRC 22015 / CBS 2517 / CECT 1963 / NBRC 1671 / NRRL Y-8276) TaxID=1071382 RepID=H2AMK3_KAZAF|nr:hypothetical protein KAFR_0A01650 [Kazachstania africana CBS 2517]CCF55603.1 hypothetical protein KAFR_0A01650 [Kazachstania africana CBS 2517]
MSSIKPVERRPSLLFDDYEKSVVVPEQKQSAIPIISKEAQEKLASKKLVSIDDLDMISLSTVFDKQMMLGSPMFLDSTDETETLSKQLSADEQNYYTHSQCYNPIPTACSALNPEENHQNPFNKLVQLRTKYIFNSFQDNRSNVKNNKAKWFMYPKPLPKFWKFENDKRLNDSIDSDNADSREYTGYYFPHSLDEEYLLGTKKFKYHYTGEFFDIAHYQEACKKFYSDMKSTIVIEKREIPSFIDFKQDFTYVVDMIQNPRFNEISSKRLNYLLDKFELFQHLKSKSEILENKQVPYRDFYNVRKVDRDLLLSGCISQRELSEFIWEKLNSEPNKAIFCDSKGAKLSLKDIFKIGCQQDEPVSIGLKLIDDDFLDWYRDVYLVNIHPFDLPLSHVENILRNNLKHYRYYLLAKTFLEFDNYIEGEYLAEILIRYVIHFLEKSKYQLAQVSVDFQFRYKSENCEDNWWVKFAKWVMKWKLVSYNIRWNVQISRCYTRLFNNNVVDNFQEFFDLIFNPLLGAENDQNIELHFFLSNVCAVDLIVSQTDAYIWKNFADVNFEPIKWDNSDNPTISQYMYYLFKNLSILNAKRHNNLQNSIVLRSTCSPSTSDRTSQFASAFNDSTLYFTEKIEALICNLLLCNGGLLQSEPIWQSSPTILYIFYLFQIPLIISPLSSASLKATSSQNILYNTDKPGQKEVTVRDLMVGEKSGSYESNPFLKLFKAGFKVSLSSKSILFNSSYTLEPLIEEYSVAASIHLLTAADLCELSRNSVLCSGYNGWYKAHWEGVNAFEGSEMLLDPIGIIDVWYDNINEDTRIKHNVPLIRRQYRHETLDQEWEFINENVSY